MDLELWALAARVRGDAPSAAALSGTPAAELAQRYRRGALPAVAAGRAGRLPAPVRAPRGGRDRPRPAPLVRRPDLRARRAGQLPAAGRIPSWPRTRSSPGAPGRPRRRSRESWPACGAGPRPRAALVRCLLRRARQLAGLREMPKDYLVRLLAARPPRARHRRRRAGRRAAGWTRPTTCASSTCAEIRGRAAGRRRPARAGRAATRGLPPGAAPPARAADPAVRRHRAGGAGRRARRRGRRRPGRDARRRPAP